MVQCKQCELWHPFLTGLAAPLYIKVRINLITSRFIIYATDRDPRTPFGVITYNGFVSELWYAKKSADFSTKMPVSVYFFSTLFPTIQIQIKLPQLAYFRKKVFGGLYLNITNGSSNSCRGLSDIILSEASQRVLTENSGGCFLYTEMVELFYFQILYAQNRTRGIANAVF